MDATLFTATSGANTITNAGGFKPDFVWTKSRSNAQSNYLVDSVRGGSSLLRSDTTGAESTSTSPAFITSFNSNGYSTDSASMVSAGYTYVGWQWQAGQGTTSSNTSGTITSTVSVNASAGFSVSTFTTTGVAATIGHGLGVAPSFYVVKQRNGAASWLAYHSSIPSAASQYLVLDLTNAVASNAGVWNNTAPTSSVFSMGTVFGAGNYVAYCWTPIAGYSAFGSYTGNGSSDGPMVYTGFQPKFIIIKRTDTTGNWTTFDSARDPYNQAGKLLYPNYSNAEETDSTQKIDFLSNGFKIRGSNSNQNASGGTYIYMAFATAPFKNSLGF
jgi:hypothetical protein